MDHSPYWIRPELKPRLRRVAVIGYMLLVGGVAICIGAALSNERSTVVPIVAPVSVHVPQATAPNVYVPAPEVKIVPPAEPAKPAPPQPTYRTLAPKLDPYCVMSTASDAARDPTCEWDDGFPAISEDGSLIARKAAPDSGPRSGYGLYVELVDVKTSRVVRSHEIVSIDESLADDKDRAKVQARIVRRVAAVQRVLDAGRYRTMIALGARREDNEEATTSTQIHAELAGDAVRIVDPATATVIWQGRFSAPARRRASDDDMCGAWGLHHIAVWWDPPTKNVLATLIYRTGGCMCPDVEMAQVQRIP